MQDFIRKWREETPGSQDRIHLNNAGSSLMPQSVLDVQLRYFTREARIGGYEAADEASGEIAQAYESVARLLHTKPGNVAIVENASVGFAQALSAFPWQKGDVIVTTRNDYISNQLAFFSLARRFHVEFRRSAELPEGGCDPESVREMLRDPKVRLLAVTWVPTNSGLIQPVEALGEIAEAAGVPYLVDGCQAVGQIDVDVTKLRCDFLSATARKFLRGPRGIGFLYVSDRALSRGDHPLFLDMRGASWVRPDDFELAKDARRFENAEFQYALVLGLGEAARYAVHQGVEAAGGRARALAARVRDQFRDREGFRVLDRGRDLAAIVTLDVGGRNARALVPRLREARINTWATSREMALIDMDEKKAPTALRVSPHYYNTEEELDTFVTALLGLAKSA